MNSRRIEELAIGAVRDFFLKTDLIAPYLSSNDKEPEWDGSLYIYTKPEQTNEQLFGRVPAQIKGKQCSEFKDELSYPISVTSLNNYLRDGGLVYFVVQVKNDCSTKIFYAELAPLCIKRILKNKKGQQSASVKMLPFETEDTKSIESQMMDFCCDRKRQISFADKPTKSFDELQKEGFTSLSLNRVGEDKANVLSSLRTKPAYLYALSPTTGLEYPIGDDKYYVKVEPLSPLTVNKALFVGETKYFDHFVYESSEKHVSYKFEDFFVVDIDFEQDNVISSKCTVSSQADMLSERIKQLEFISDLLKHKGFILDGITHTLNSVSEKDVTKIDADLEDLKLLKTALKKLGCHKDLDMSNLSSDDERNIDLLIKSVAKGELVEISNPKTVLCLKLANLRLFLYVYEKEKGLCNIISFFDSSLGICYETKERKGKFVTSMFTAVQQDGYERFDNIPYDRIVESYKEAVQYNVYIYERANLDLLMLLLAYDNLKASNDYRCEMTINAGLQLSEWLLKTAIRSENIPEEMLIINHLQVIKRQRDLNKEERLKLIGITQNNNVSEMMKAGASLLLGNVDMFDYHYNLLPDVEQELMKTYPIYTFYKQ